MRTTIIIACAIILEVAAAAVIGSEKYKGSVYEEIHRTLSESAIKVILTLMSLGTFVMYGLFVARDVFYPPIEDKNVVQVFWVIVGIFVIYLWVITIEMIRVSKTLYLFELFAPIFGVIALIILGAAVQYSVNTGYFLPGKALCLLGGSWIYYKILYRVSVVGGNIRIIKLEKKIQLLRD